MPDAPPPLTKRPCWNAATIVDPDANVSGSTSVACWLVGLVNGSELSWVRATLARAADAVIPIAKPKATATASATVSARFIEPPPLIFRSPSRKAPLARWSSREVPQKQYGKRRSRRGRRRQGAPRPPGPGSDRGACAKPSGTSVVGPPHVRFGPRDGRHGHCPRGHLSPQCARSFLPLGHKPLPRQLFPALFALT